MLEAHSGVMHSCLTDPSLRVCAWRLAGLSLLTLALVSVVAFFWRGYSFSRYTVILFWLLQVGAGVVAAAGLRAWLGRNSGAPEAWVWAVGSASPEQALREFLEPTAPAMVSRFADVGSLVTALEGLETEAGPGELIVVLASSEWHALADVTRALERLPLRATIALEGLPAGRVSATASFVRARNWPESRL